MKKYTLKRVLTSFFTLLVILLVLFILMQLMPGSPFNDEKLNDDQRAALYVKYGLDQPVVVQFANYAKNMLKGDLGVSYNISKNTPISQMIQTRLPISIGIGGLAVTIGAIVGLLLGLLAALKHNTIWDSLATVISVIGVSVPSYVFALGLSYSLGFRLQWSQCCIRQTMRACPACCQVSRYPCLLWHPLHVLPEAKCWRFWAVTTCFWQRVKVFPDPH